MPENTTATTETVVIPDTTSEPTIEAVKAEYEGKLADAIKTLELTKKAQSGSDATVQKLQEELKEVRKGQMSDKERLDYEKQQADAEKKLSLQKQKELEDELTMFKFVASKGVELDIAEFLKPGDELGLQDQLARVQKMLDKRVKPLQDEIAKLKAELGRPGGATGAAVTDWRKATVDQVNAEYKRIEATEGAQRAQAWHNNIYK